VLGSITDPAALALACAGQDAVIHLAAKVGVTGPWDEFESVNVHGTVGLLDAARRAGVRGVVHVSSPSVAHAGHALVGAGAAPADPSATRGHYATSKAMAELAALDASSADLPWSRSGPISCGGRVTHSWSDGSSSGPVRAGSRWSARVRR
jgi:2-alkyl-3-oxoalkanoate reductase